MPDGRTRVASVAACILGGVALVALGSGALAACSSSSSSGAKAAPDAASESSTVTDASSSDGGTADAACAVYDASGLDEAAVAAGMQQISTYHCPRCHQPMGMGTIVLSGSTMNVGEGGIVAYGPNLTPDPATGLGCWTDPQVQRAILDGIDNTGATLCVMPQFAQKGMDAGTASEIVEFLRSLPPVMHQVPDTNCPADGGAD